ncbi:hypothetical protein ACO2I3_04065 [Leptospira interrogans]
MKQQTIFKDDIALVPLGKSGRFAVCDKADYLRLADLGIKRWKLDRSWVVTHSRLDKSNLMVARLITNAPAGYRVVYLNNDKLDLRRENLALKPYGSKRYGSRNTLVHTLPELFHDKIDKLIPLVDLVLN